MLQPLSKNQGETFTIRRPEGSLSSPPIKDIPNPNFPSLRKAESVPGPGGPKTPKFSHTSEYTPEIQRERAAPVNPTSQVVLTEHSRTKMAAPSSQGLPQPPRTQPKLAAKQSENPFAPAPQQIQYSSQHPRMASQPVQQGPKSQQQNQQPVLRNQPRQQQQAQEQQRTQEQRTQKKRKNCKACGNLISGQFVRALNSTYHIECFLCHECGVQCSSKFFPTEVTNSDGTVVQVPLCELDYFKKLDLICHSCNNALRGPYITALGNKYHLEHFKCSACSKVFESDESYYEHENSIYCHYHYSKLFATKCEGCLSSIVKQFVELFKGGKNQQWHPECFMVFKFWNVYFTPDCVGLQDKLQPDSPQLNPNKLAPEELIFVELRIESVVMNCWQVLSGFEEISASCISEMLLAACTGKRSSGLLVTGRLVLYVEILFHALDFVQNMCFDSKPDSNLMNDSKSMLAEEVYSVDAFAKYQTLRKEPRNFSGKLMSYLAILRKSNQLSDSGSLSAELLSVITGCAHYLKLLIRIGLNNAMKLNKFRCDTNALDSFLLIIKRYEEIEVTDKLVGDSRISIGSRLAVPYLATDACRGCKKSIEKSCVRFMNLRWHMKCFECSFCHKKPTAEFKVETFMVGSDELILCMDCSRSNIKAGVGYSSGLVKVSDLSQLAYLLKIAIFRSKSAIKKDDDSSGSVTRQPSMIGNIDEESETESGYSSTLREVTSLRTKREGQKLSNSIKKNARKSVILEAPEAVTARSENISEVEEERSAGSRKNTAASYESYVALAQDSDQFDFRSNALKIRDDPPHRLASNSLDRTSDLLKNEKSLTLDDIPRIVAAEQAREQRPNAFKHHNSLYQKKTQLFKSITPGAGITNREVLVYLPSKPDPTPPAPVKYYSELSKEEHYILRHIAVEALLEISANQSKEELASFIQTKKQGNFWDKFKFSGGDKGKLLKVFGADLTDVTTKYGVDSDLGVGPSQLRIPIVVDDVIHALRLKDMSVEGIFRLNGNIKNLRELTDQINADPLKSPDFGKYSAVQLAALMKKWLREMPNPLLTFNLYDLWISSRRSENPVMGLRTLQLAYCLLPRSNRNLLEVLLYFFSWVASFAEIDEESGSKMDTHNLATVIAPNVLLSKTSGDSKVPQSSDSHFLAIEVVNQLIEIHEELAVVPEDIWRFYEKCQFGTLGKGDSVSSKEIFNKIGKVSKENKHYFQEFLKQEDSAPSHQNTIKRGQTKVHGTNSTR